MLSNRLLSDEFVLAAACCRWPSSAARDGAVRGAAAAGVDWRRFLRIVRRQRVEGLVSSALAGAGVALPREVAASLAEEAGAIVRQNLSFAAESVRLQRLFAAAELPLLFVKGATLAMLAYGTLAVKRAWDIDMAVPTQRIGEACDLLARAGYARVEPGPELSDRQFQTWLSLSKESVWRHGRSGTVVELHSSLVDNPLLLSGVDALSPRQLVTISPGIELATLQKDALFSYLCVHGAGHAWSRMKWIADVGALLAPDDPAEIERLYRASLALGAGRCTAQALLLCAELFEMPLPAQLESELRGDRATRWLARVALEMMAGRHAETELDDSVLGTLPIHLSHFLLAPGLGYKASELKRKSASPYDQATIKLPGPLRFLYPLLLVPNWLRRRVRGPMTH